MKRPTPPSNALMNARVSFAAACLALGSILAAPRARAQSAAPAASVVVDANTVQVANSAAEVMAIRPLVDRGVVVLAREIDMAESSSATAYVRVHAPRAEVFAAIADASRYREYMPWVVGSDELSRRNGRSAHRLHLRVASFDIDGMLTMRTVGSTAIEATIHQDAVGSGYARWDLLDDGPADTIVRLTVHAALEPDSFLVRLATGVSRESYTFGNIASAFALALHVKRGVEQRAGVASTVRTPVTDIAQPPPDGAWMDIARHTNVLFVGLDARGEPVQELALGASYAGASALRERVVRIDELQSHLPWFTEIHVTARDDASVAYSTRLGSPFARGVGENRMQTGRDARVVDVTGVSGDFAGERNRWDFVQRDVAFMMSTGSTIQRHFTAPQRALIASDPLVGTGLSLAWRVLSLRWLFAGTT